jgi:hypothetical protein
LVIVMSFASTLALVARSATCSNEYCTGQPRACPAPLPGLASAQPEKEAHRRQFRLQFFNAAAEAAQLSWIANNGTAVTLMAIEPGQKRRLSARMGDAFRATGASSGALLMEYFTGPVIVHECAQCSEQSTQLVFCPPRVPSTHNASRRPEYEPAGFVNDAPAAIDLYAIGAQCESLLTTDAPLAPRGQRHFASWAGQRFRVRRHDTSQLLLEHTVGEVLIRPCTVGESKSGAAALGLLAEIREGLKRLEARQHELANRLHGWQRQTDERLRAIERHAAGATLADDGTTAGRAEEEEARPVLQAQPVTERAEKGLAQQGLGLPAFSDAAASDGGLTGRTPADTGADEVQRVEVATLGGTRRDSD